VKDCVAFYDQHGRSAGRAELCYAMKTQALSAIKALNNVEADGKLICTCRDIIIFIHLFITFRIYSTCSIVAAKDKFTAR
jgi:hypothetical protein